MYRQISLLDLKMVTFVTLAFLATTDFSSLAGQDLPPDEPPHDWTPTAINYENVPYPYPVDFLEVSLYGEDHRMAYMDVAPFGESNGQTVVLFHGMNFFVSLTSTFRLSLESATRSINPSFSIDFSIRERLFGSIPIRGAIFVTGVPSFS